MKVLITTKVLTTGGAEEENVIIKTARELHPSPIPKTWKPRSSSF